MIMIKDPSLNEPCGTSIGISNDFIVIDITESVVKSV